MVNFGKNELPKHPKITYFLLLSSTFLNCIFVILFLFGPEFKEKTDSRLIKRISKLETTLEKSIDLHIKALELDEERSVIINDTFADNEKKFKNINDKLAEVAGVTVSLMKYIRQLQDIELEEKKKNQSTAPN